jgi:hypothetical protein
MTIERFEEGFGYVVHCDLCDEELYLPDADIFDEVIAGMKEHGWKSSKNLDDDWDNICPTCLEKELHEKGESG